MLPSGFKGSSQLSDITKLTWMSGGNIRLIRKKMDMLGRTRGYGYKVYIKPATYLAILDKSGEIDSRMRSLSEEENPKPSNILLHGSTILQVSLFQKDVSVPELYPYYGIHLLDSDGDIVAGAGINLTQEEYVNFLTMLMKWRAAVTPVIEVASDSEMKREEGVCGEGVDVDERYKPEKKKMRYAEASSTKSPRVKYSINMETPQRKIGITLYGWEWCLPEADGTVKQAGKGSQGGWFVDPKHCVEEAKKQRPDDGCYYKMCTFTRKKYYAINHDMFDASVGKLLQKSAVELELVGSDGVDGVDYEKHGANLLSGISFGDIFDMCKRAIQLYQSFTEADDNWLMNAVCEYTKDENIFHLLKYQYLDKYFVQLFNYLHK